MAVDLDSLVVGPTIGIFGTSGTYTPMTAVLDTGGNETYGPDGEPIRQAGTPYAVTGVFDEQFIEVTPGGKGPFSSTDALDLGAPGGLTDAMPVYGVQLSAMLTEPAQGDALTIGSTAYVVREVQPDGHGWAKLLLNLA